jgi:hypothetical protein
VAERTSWGHERSNYWLDGAYTVGILQYNPVQSAILRDLIGQFPAIELDYIVVCPQ